MIKILNSQNLTVTFIPNNPSICTLYLNILEIKSFLNLLKFFFYLFKYWIKDIKMWTEINSMWNINMGLITFFLFIKNIQLDFKI